MSKIWLRDHSLGIEVGRSINLSNSNWRGNGCLVVDNLQFRGKYLMGREHVQLLFQNITQKWERDWTIGTMNFEESVEVFFIICLNEWNLWILLVLILYLNGICAFFFIDPLYEWNLWMFFLIDPLYEWNLWMFFSIYPLYAWNMWMLFYWSFIWMESMNVFFIVYLYEWIL